jgi:hypothetical protein
MAADIKLGVVPANSLFFEWELHLAATHSPAWGSNPTASSESPRSED